MDESPAELDAASARQIGVHSTLEIEDQLRLGNVGSRVDIYSEDVKPLLPECAKEIDMLNEDRNVTTKEIAKFGFYIAPLWFATEVRPFRIVSVIFSCSFLHVRHSTCSKEKLFLNTTCFPVNPLRNCRYLFFILPFPCYSAKDFSLISACCYVCSRPFLLDKCGSMDLYIIGLQNGQMFLF